MTNKTGIVMEVKKRTTFIMTSNGEFVEVKLNKTAPSIGDVYTGEVSYSIPYYRYVAAVASIMFVLLIGGGAYAYSIPVSSTIISINPSLKLQANFVNRIIKVIPLNNDGIMLMKNLNIKNKTINDGLTTIVSEAEKEHFINESYKKGNDALKQISISFEGSNDKKADISKFENYLNKKNLKYKITSISKNKNHKVKMQNNKNTSNETINFSNTLKENASINRKNIIKNLDNKKAKLLNETKKIKGYEKTHKSNKNKTLKQTVENNKNIDKNLDKIKKKFTKESKKNINIHSNHKIKDSHK